MVQAYTLAMDTARLVGCPPFSRSKYKLLSMLPTARAYTVSTGYEPSLTPRVSASEKTA